MEQEPYEFRNGPARIVMILLVAGIKG